MCAETLPGLFDSASRAILEGAAPREELATEPAADIPAGPALSRLDGTPESLGGSASGPRALVGRVEVHSYKENADSAKDGAARGLHPVL